MKWLINAFGKLAGAGKIFGYLNGIKSYLGGGALMLSGLSQILTEIITINDLSGLLDFIKQLPQDQGVLAFAAGLAAVGLRHATAKAAAPVQP